MAEKQTHDNLSAPVRAALFDYLCRLGDDMLVLGHNLSSWCGHAPILEEDMALANVALDAIGQAEALLKLAGDVEGKDRSEDDLAYFRDEYEFRNLQLVERPNGHFGDTLARQFLFDAWAYFLYEALCDSKFQPLADIAQKALKEITYHLRHSKGWIVRLGDGTEESHEKIQASLNDLWEYTGELFYSDDVDNLLVEASMVPDPARIEPKWRQLVQDVLTEATLSAPPEPVHWPMGARTGRHSEYLGHLLTEMQILARSHPGAAW